VHVDGSCSVGCDRNEKHDGDAKPGSGCIINHNNHNTSNNSSSSYDVSARVIQARFKFGSALTSSRSITTATAPRPRAGANRRDARGGEKAQWRAHNARVLRQNAET
jgi:hypothetical protein